VLNSFDRACNLIGQNGAILSLVTFDVGLTPFGAVVAPVGPGPFRQARPNEPVGVTPNRIVLGGLTVTFDTAKTWNPAPDWDRLRAIFTERSQLLEQLVSLAGEARVAGSLLDLLHDPIEPSGVQSALLARMRRGVGELVQGLASGSVEQCRSAARTLAGLGGGLTPAGDDFMVGAMLAARAGLAGRQATELCAEIAEAAAPLTTSLSAAYLRAAARGECMQRWHKVFEAALTQSVGDLRLGIGDLAAVGHTSGADALAGFVYLMTQGR
jgi:hypothetical protein